MNKQLSMLAVVLIYSITAVNGNCPDDTDDNTVNSSPFAHNSSVSAPAGNDFVLSLLILSFGRMSNSS